MPGQFHIIISGDKTVKRRLRLVGVRSQDFRPAFRIIINLLQKETTRQFDTQGSHSRGGWPPLNPSYKAAKVRAGLDPRILHATLRLVKSLTRRGSGYSSDSIFQFLPLRMRYGTSVSYAKYHQSDRPRKVLPRRAPLVVRRRARLQINRIMRRHVRGRPA